MNSEEKIKVLEAVMELSKHLDTMSVTSNSEFLAFDRISRVFISLAELIQFDKMGKKPELDIYEFSNGNFVKVI